MPNKLTAVTQLINFISSLGTLRYPKKQGSKGLFVYNPTSFDMSKAVALADSIGWQAIYKDKESKYFDPVTQEMKVVPPSLFVCPAKPGATKEEATDYINSILAG